MKKVKSVKYWIGLVDGKPHLFSDPGYYRLVERGDFFRTKKDALKCYEEVVRVIIKEII